MRARLYLIEAFGKAGCTEEEEEEEEGDKEGEAGKKGRAGGEGGAGGGTGGEGGDQHKSLGSNSDQRRLINMVRGDCSMGNGKYYFDTDSDPPYLTGN